MVTDEVDVAEVVLWGRVIGAVAWDESRQLASFEYADDFQSSGIELAPLTMPLSPQIHRFPDLARETYRGLPALLADSLPDKFGNAIIDQWLLRQGRALESFSPVERLCYIGHRGMGALEFRPAIARGAPSGSVPVEVERLVELARQVLLERSGLSGQLSGEPAQDKLALNDILRVGTSAGGARAKAIIAWNPTTNDIRSGQVEAPAGYEHWLLKFDGVGSRDKELADPAGYGKIEYAYYLMARAAGISISESRLLHEHGRSHFMTRRFDRTAAGAKLHMQSLCAMAHLDFNQAGAHAYEQAILVVQRLRMPMSSLVEMYRRMVFNVIARNHDDHTKNIAFLMSKRGEWSLAPAFDLIYAFNPDGEWTRQHQMTVNGKQDGIELSDLLEVASGFSIPSARKLVADVVEAVAHWPMFAAEAGVDKAVLGAIAHNHRLFRG